MSQNAAISTSGTAARLAAASRLRLPVGPAAAARGRRAGATGRGTAHQLYSRLPPPGLEARN
ncbi:hypothetical protein [Rhodopila globiformis]|uniref:Uncharacterized protein n=1 Tax=Rhodopila globiformis TaxID=1071 RepID=A0A2S6MXG1_RHOGL|nr:hypothetical protein [Rhodopila globiformis]PPQ27029.1 hypothetical protein CCS01_28235 [Rhodopila globiformis]